ncbi:serine-rich adhesin for platelets-like [Ptychodera flava]|uniref:serine-rich adhesin for platelets-like n=1 Tax=Ptychodera flava TaxID=63121 RepID=UPI00396A0B23
MTYNDISTAATVTTNDEVSTNDKTTTNEVSTNDKTTKNDKISTNDKTTTNEVSTNDKTTTNEVSTNDKTTTNEVSTNDKTTTNEVSTNDKATTNDEMSTNDKAMVNYEESTNDMTTTTNISTHDKTTKNDKVSTNDKAATDIAMTDDITPWREPKAVTLESMHNATVDVESRKFISKEISVFDNMMNENLTNPYNTKVDIHLKSRERFTNAPSGEYQGYPFEDVYYPATWMDAKAMCENNHIWIDANDREEEGVFIHSDGSSIRISAWDIGEPSNNYGNEDCVILGASRMWKASDCEVRVSRFLCHYGAASVPDSMFYIGGGFKMSRHVAPALYAYEYCANDGGALWRIPWRPAQEEFIGDLRVSGWDFTLSFTATVTTNDEVSTNDKTTTNEVSTNDKATTNDEMSTNDKATTNDEMSTNDKTTTNEVSTNDKTTTNEVSTNDKTTKNDEMSTNDKATKNDEMSTNDKAMINYEVSTNDMTTTNDKKTTNNISTNDKTTINNKVSTNDKAATDIAMTDDITPWREPKAVTLESMHNATVDVESRKFISKEISVFDNMMNENLTNPYNTKVDIHLKSRERFTNDS